MIREIVKNLIKKPQTVEKDKIPKGARGKIIIDKEKCIGCGICARVCPSGAIEIKNGKAFYNPFKCSFCGLCVRYCPRGAIKQTEDVEVME